MFTWICPTCGREVPPSQSECMNCAPKTAVPTAPAPTPVVQPIAPPLPNTEVKGYAPAPTTQALVYQAPVYQAPVAYAPPAVPPAPGLPPWLITLMVFGGLLGLGAAFYFLYLPSSKKEVETVAATPTAETAAAPKANPMVKQLELTGVRILEDARQKLQVRMIVINHSAADMGEVKMKVTLTSGSGTGPSTIIGTFPVTVSDLGPMEAKEAKGSIATKLRAYELPDWQFLKATAEIIE